MVLMDSKEKMIGKKAPDFDLPGVDGKPHSLSSALRHHGAVVVMFVCNHCPYVQAYWGRLVQLAKSYQDKDVVFLAINPNDEKNYPDDSMEKMKIVAREWEFPFAYLRDYDQSVAKAYDAVCTPEMFIVDQKGMVQYHGGIDDNWQEASKVRERFLQKALDEVLAGKKVSQPTPHAMGCSIKWGNL